MFSIAKTIAKPAGKTVQIGSLLRPVTGFTSAFVVNTILGQLNWTDTNNGKAQYEVYSSTNGAANVLLTTTIAGATSYQDTTCKQNAYVTYSIKAKIGTRVSSTISATALITPLCFKTDQTTNVPVIFNVLNISAGTVNINWGDGTNADYTGNNTNITKNYGSTGIKNISLSGDIGNITSFRHIEQIKSFGVLTNWILPPVTGIRIYSCSFTGVLTNWTVSVNTTDFNLSSNGFSGSLPTITDHATNIIDYQLHFNHLSDSNLTVFRKAMRFFNISDQYVAFSTAKINNVLKALADYYQTNAPTQNCVFTLSGANMGIPTGGASNADITRLVGYYTAAGRTATVLVRTS